MTNYIGISVNQKPVSVEWECPHCGTDNIIPYYEFLGGVEYCDWDGSDVECKECGYVYEIDNIEWY